MGEHNDYENEHVGANPFDLRNPKWDPFDPRQIKYAERMARKLRTKNKRRRSKK